MIDVDLIEWLKEPKRADKWAGWFTFATLLQKAPPALRSAKKLRAVVKQLTDSGHMLSCNYGRELRLNPYTTNKEEKQNSQSIDVFPINVNLYCKDSSELMAKIENVDGYSATVCLMTSVTPESWDEISAAIKSALEMMYPKSNAG